MYCLLGTKEELKTFLYHHFWFSSSSDCSSEGANVRISLRALESQSEAKEMRDPRWGMEKNHLHVGALILWMSHKFKGMTTDCAESITELPQEKK